MLTVLLALAAAVAFGALTVAVRWGLMRINDPEGGALVATGVATAIAAVTSSQSLSHGAATPGLAAFLGAGTIAPGASQVVLSLAIARAGAARTAVLMGSAPMLSVVVAFVLLGEPFRWLIALGTASVVAGAVLLSLERARPREFKASGLWLALVCALLFASRDNLLRWQARAAHPPTPVASAGLLGMAFIVILSYVALIRHGRLLSMPMRTAIAFAPAGVTLALGYELLLAALARGDVSLVSPLNATGSLWAVVIAAIVLGGGEALGRRTAVAALLVVAGGVIVGLSG